MNHTGFPLKRSFASEARVPRDTDDFIDLERLLAVVLRQARVLILCVLIGLGLGILYLTTTPPIYMAASHVLIDERLRKIVDDTSAVANDLQTDSSMLSQIEIVRSARLAEAVVDALALDRNESFMQPPTSLLAQAVGSARWAFRSVLSLFGQQPEQAVLHSGEGYEEMLGRARREAAVLGLQRGVVAQRAGRSHVIAIGFQSHDPRLAAEITNAYAEAYVADQLNASFEATEQAALWLEGRITELRESSQTAALAVERYRAEHGLTAASGELVTDRQLADLNSQLALARADTARALARYQQYQSITDAGPDAAVQNATLSEEQGGSEVLNTLKTRYLTVTRREKEIADQFGAEHQQAVALRRQKADLAQQMHEELTQLAVSYRNAYEVALSRETALQENVSRASGESDEAKQSQVRLRELEQQATALTSLYQAFLTRYEEATQQSSFPISKVRVISEAGVPRSPSSPRTIVVLGLSLVLGLMMGGAVGALNEFNERFFRTGDDVRDRLGARFLGYLPMLGSAAGRKGKASRDPSAPPSTPQGRTSRTKPEMRYAVEAPESAFAETLRNVKFASDVVLQDTPARVIGVLSALPGEGKSTFAANFAQLLAANGHRTLLIDGDLRNPGLSRGLGLGAEGGLLEAIVQERSWQTVATRDTQTGLVVVPALVRGRFSHTGEVLASAGMKRFLQKARESFEYIIVDLPPLGPVIDAKAFAPMTDGLVVVVAWGQTPRALVRSVLTGEPAVADRILGVVLNKVNMKALSRYGSFGGSEKYVNQYSNYYLEPKQKAQRPS
jgi:polysaccharide biosynthesis transport protein